MAHFIRHHFALLIGAYLGIGLAYFWSAGLRFPGIPAWKIVIAWPYAMWTDYNTFTPGGGSGIGAGGASGSWFF